LEWTGGESRHGCGKLVFARQRCENVRPGKSVIVSCQSESDNISVLLSSIELNGGTMTNEIFIDFNESGEQKSLMLNTLGEPLFHGFTITADMTISLIGSIVHNAQCIFEIEEVIL